MSKRILIVEDDPALNMLYKTILTDAGYEVVTAANAKAAIDIATEQTVDLIIEDLSLPDLNGIQLLHCIRQLPHCQNLPVVILSGSTGRIESAKKSRELFAAFLHKPVDKTQLLTVIQSLI